MPSSLDSRPSTSASAVHRITTFILAQPIPSHSDHLFQKLLFSRKSRRRHTFQIQETHNNNAPESQGRSNRIRLTPLYNVYEVHSLNSLLSRKPTSSRSNTLLELHQFDDPDEKVAEVQIVPSGAVIGDKNFDPTATGIASGVHGCSLVFIDGQRWGGRLEGGQATTQQRGRRWCLKLETEDGRFQAIWRRGKKNTQGGWIWSFSLRSKDAREETVCAWKKERNIEILGESDTPQNT